MKFYRVTKFEGFFGKFPRCYDRFWILCKLGYKTCLNMPELKTLLGSMFPINKKIITRTKSVKTLYVCACHEHGTKRQKFRIPDGSRTARDHDLLLDTGRVL